MRKRGIYKKTLPRQMYAYFISYNESSGAPSFSKFARRLGLTLEELSSFRKRYPSFDEAWRECSEIRRDFLIDGALSRRFDSSFTKFLYEKEKEEYAPENDERLIFTLEVIGEENEA